MKWSEVAAWWGAIIATSVLLWDIYKWKRSGPIINISSSPNMESYGGVPDYLMGRTFVTIVVTNTGNKNTTLTHLVGFYYKSLVQKIKNKVCKKFIVLDTRPQPLPYVLEPGGRWMGIIEQNDELEEMSRNGYLFCGVYHSFSRKPALVRLVINIVSCT